MEANYGTNANNIAQQCWEVLSLESSCFIQIILQIRTYVGYSQINQKMNGEPFLLNNFGSICTLTSQQPGKILCTPQTWMPCILPLQMIIPHICSS